MHFALCETLNGVANETGRSEFESISYLSTHAHMRTRSVNSLQFLGVIVTIDQYSSDELTRAQSHTAAITDDCFQPINDQILWEMRTVRFRSINYMTTVESENTTLFM